jgi:hypothetical protein
MAEVSGGIGKKGSGRGAAAGAGSKVTLRTKKRRGSGTRKGGRREGRSGSKAKGGAECLKEAVNQKLKTNSGKLADKLLEKATSGDLKTIRLVVSLAEQHEAKEPDPGPLRSQALAWAMEPPWEGPPPVLVDRDGQILRDEDGEIRYLAPEVSQGDPWKRASGAQSQQADEPANVEEWPEGWEKKIIEAELLKQRQS